MSYIRWLVLKISESVEYQKKQIKKYFPRNIDGIGVSIMFYKEKQVEQKSLSQYD